MFWMVNDGHIITEDEFGLNFLTFVLELRKNLGKLELGNWPDRKSNLSTTAVDIIKFI